MWKSSGCRKHVELILTFFFLYSSKFKIRFFGKNLNKVKKKNKDIYYLLWCFCWSLLTCRWQQAWLRPLLSVSTNFISERFNNDVSELQRHCTADRLGFSLIKLCSWCSEEDFTVWFLRSCEQGNVVLSIQSFRDKSTENTSLHHTWSYLKNITHYIIWQSLTPNLLKSRKNTPEDSKCHLWASASVSSLKCCKNSLQRNVKRSWGLTVQVSFTAKAPIRENSQVWRWMMKPAADPAQVRTRMTRAMMQLRGIQQILNAAIKEKYEAVRNLSASLPLYPALCVCVCVPGRAHITMTSASSHTVIKNKSLNFFIFVLKASSPRLYSHWTLFIPPVETDINNIQGSLL